MTEQTTQVVILRGVSGCGKSTLTRTLVAKARQVGHDAVVVSADDLFYESGSYVFDLSRLEEAHTRCFRRFLDALTRNSTCSTPKVPLVIVDNTNSTAEEVAPYVLGALAYEAAPEIVTILCDPHEAAARNEGRAPLQAVLGQDARLRQPLPFHLAKYEIAR